MKNILARTHRLVLQRSSWSRVLLAFDYDGTLAPIVDDPGSATMRPSTARLLAMATTLYPVVVISGRARADVMTRLHAVGVREVVGNHGIESRHGREPATGQIQRWLKVLGPRLASCPGVEIEPKRYTLAVHYRRARARRGALATILEAAATLVDTRVVGGKLVVNLVPAGAPHKGVALARERQRLRCDTAIYVGDDDTDEDVFNLDQPRRLLGIRVGRTRASAAAYCIPRQAEIDHFLRTLIELRAERRQVRRRGGR